MITRYIDIKDIGSTREVLVNQSPRGVRNLLLVATMALTGLGVVMNFLNIQSAEKLSGLIVAEHSARVRMAEATGKVAEVLVLDGQKVEPGQTVMRLDAYVLEDRLATLQQEEASTVRDLESYAQLRDAVATGDTPFDPELEPKFYYSLMQYRQQLAQADDTRREVRQSQSATEKAAHAVLSQSEASLNDLTVRSTELSRLAAAIRERSAYSSTDAYCQALFLSYREGRPDAGGIEGSNPSQATAAYDASFVSQIEGQIDSVKTQQDAYRADVARLQAQLSTQGLDPTSGDSSYITSQFMLSSAIEEQALHQKHASQTLEIQSLELSIEQTVLTTPIEGLIEMNFDWQVGDFVQTGQQVFTIIPDAGQPLLEVPVPARIRPLVQPGMTLACSLPSTIGTKTTSVQCQAERISASYRVDEQGQAYYVAYFTITLDRRASQENVTPSNTPGVPMIVTLPVREMSILRWLGEKIGFLEPPR